MSATGRLTICLTTVERRKMYESWIHLEAHFKQKILPEKHPRIASLFVSTLGEVL